MTVVHPLPSRFLGAAIALCVAATLPACNNRGHDRWVTTEDSRVDIDWDAVGEAYKEADGPEDLEQRVNEIYTGDEVISISVRDSDEKTQIVTGFFDKNEDGQVGDDEKIFTIQRDLLDQDRGQYQIAGYGPYGGYHSPVWSLASGMLMGSMMSRMFSPGYQPAYRTAYTTAPTRRSNLVSHRDSWRKANPDKFNARASKSGRSYGAKGGRFGGGRTAPRPWMPSRGGGRFGHRGTPRHQATRLVA